MNENNKDCEEYDFLKDVIEFQNNMFNPGHYIGTGKVMPTVSAPGNATPLAVMCFFAAVLFLTFGLFLFFSDANVTSFGLIESDMANKIFVLIMMLVISLVFLVFGFVYLKKAKNIIDKRPCWKTNKLIKLLKMKCYNEPAQNVVNPMILIIQNVLTVNLITLNR